MISVSPAVAAALLLFSSVVAAQTNEYLPPPTGPYQSSVVINAVERDSSHEAQIYRFPPADLGGPEFEVRPPVKDLPISRPDAIRLPPGSAESGGLPGVNSEFASDPSVGTAKSPWEGMPAQQGQYPATDPGVWGNPYGYSAYPYGYYNGYMANPYPAAPSPWAVNPAPAYPGR